MYNVICLQWDGILIMIVRSYRIVYNMGVSLRHNRRKDNDYRDLESARGISLRWGWQSLINTYT